MAFRAHDFLTKAAKNRGIAAELCTTLRVAEREQRVLSVPPRERCSPTPFALCCTRRARVATMSTGDVATRGSPGFVSCQEWPLLIGDALRVRA
eukprot:6177770-Pleurochrysis_carterae.AAC.3